MRRGSDVFVSGAEQREQERRLDALARARAEGRIESKAVKRASVADDQSELERLRQRVAELEREPDPGQAPFRGTSVVVFDRPEREEASVLKVARERDERERIAYLERLAVSHPDPELRERALAVLARKETP